LASGPPLQLNFGQTRLSRADSCQWVNVWFLQGRSGQAEERRKKLTEHEVALVAAQGISYPQQPKPLDVSGRRSIPLPRNLSVTANFLRPQTGAKKETPPGGAGNDILKYSKDMTRIRDNQQNHLNF